MARRFDKMTNQDRDELLSAYLDGELSGAEQAHLEQQLAADPGLQSELDALKRTVEMMRDLPVQPIPRNFILPQSVATRPRSAPAVRPRRRWAAPLLTAATSVVSLLFAVVLAGDLLLAPGMIQMASMPAADEQKLEAPQPVAEGVEVESEAEDEKRADFAPSPTPGAADDSGVTPPMAIELAPTAEASGTPLPPPAPIGAEKEGAAGEENGTDAESPERAGTESPAAAAGGGGGEDTDAITPTLPDIPTPAPLPSAVPSAETHVAPPSAAPTEELTLSATTDESSPEPIEEPVEEWGQDEEESPIPRQRWTSPVRMLTIALGLTALGLAVITILAWRARRR
jgi:hypothetical protein